MDSAYTIAVLRDIYGVCFTALGLALPVYAFFRVKRGLAWNTQGNVLTRPYDILDGVVGIGVLWLLVSLSLSPQAEPPTFEQFNSNGYAAQLFISSLFMLIIAFAVVTYMNVARQMNPAEMFGLRQMPIVEVIWKAALWLFCGGLLLALIVISLKKGFSLGALEDQEPQAMVKMFKEATNPFVKSVIVMAAVIFAPIAEEVLFRGYLYGITKRFTEQWFATLFTALIFACVHTHLGSFLPLMLLGILFALAYEVTGSLFVPIFMHSMFNGFNVVQLLISNSNGP